MGNHPAVVIETPPIDLSQWQYINLPCEYEEYGYFQTLRNLRTGQLIDEYDLNWANKEQYQSYLKSFNWRYGQSNVVNTRYIKQKNEYGICSNSYMAKVYIQHMKIRMNEIGDIPYPDNLNLLMQALEGYNKIYQYTKYFPVEENQICIDQQGNVKVWVNPDLSLNVHSGPANLSNLGEVQMIQSLVEIVDSNLDKELEPSPSFFQFFQKNKVPGMSFQDAKVLVLQYAKNNNTNIPSRFQAIFNLDQRSQTLQKTDNHPSVRQIIDRQANRPLYTNQSASQKNYQTAVHPPLISPKHVTSPGISFPNPSLTNISRTQIPYVPRPGSFQPSSVHLYPPSQVFPINTGPLPALNPIFSIQNGPIRFNNSFPVRPMSSHTVQMPRIPINSVYNVPSNPGSRVQMPVMIQKSSKVSAKHGQQNHMWPQFPKMIPSQFEDEEYSSNYNSRNVIQSKVERPSDSQVGVHVLREPYSSTINAQGQVVQYNNLNLRHMVSSAKEANVESSSRKVSRQQELSQYADSNVSRHLVNQSGLPQREISVSSDLRATKDPRNEQALDQVHQMGSQRRGIQLNLRRQAVSQEIPQLKYFYTLDDCDTIDSAIVADMMRYI